MPLTIRTQAVLCALVLGGAAYLWAHPEALLGDEEAEDGAAETVPAEAAAEKAVPVVVAAVERMADDVRFEAIGTGRARRSVLLRSEDEGKIARLELAPGRRFAEGDVLLALEDREQRLAIRLAETRAGEADRVRARFARLRDTGAAAFARLDEADTAAEIAAIELERAREALADRIITAPFDGVSGLSAVEIGDWIDSDVAIASFDDRSVIFVEIALPEALLGRVAVGTAVAAETPSEPGRIFGGRVAEIDSRIDPASRTTRVRAELPNDEDRLRPGASFRVRLDLPGPEHPVVPELALQFTRGGLHVWRVAESVAGTATGAERQTVLRAERVGVRLVRRRDGLVLVDGALGPGDRVVVEGTQRLGDDIAVRTVGGERSGGS